MLQAISDFAKSDRTAFIREMQEAQACQQDSDIKKKKRRLSAAQKRAGELERLACKIYEDNALGRLRLRYLKEHRPSCPVRLRKDGNAVLFHKRKNFLLHPCFLP